jgi:hypothetical protein
LNDDEFLVHDEGEVIATDAARQVSIVVDAERKA